MTTNENEIGDDLVITKTTRRAAGAGTWVSGRLNGHFFDALVFREHAENPNYEIGGSRISKLTLREFGYTRTLRFAIRQCVANFDRGWDVRPTTDAASAIVDFLAAGLADHIYGPNLTPNTNEPSRRRLLVDIAKPVLMRGSWKRQSPM